MAANEQVPLPKEPLKHRKTAIIVGDLPSAETVRANTNAANRRTRRQALVLALSAIGVGAAAVISRGKSFGQESETQSPPKAKEVTLEPKLKLGENKIANPGFEFNPSTDPIPTFWTLRPDNTHIRVSEKERTPEGHNSIEVEGFYDENGRFQAPILETAIAVPVDISNDSFEYKLSFKSKVPQGFKPVILIRPTVPDYSPNGTYHFIGNPARFSPENTSPGKWNEKAYEFSINNSDLPKETKGVVIQLALIKSSTITLNANAGSKSYFGDISLNEVENPLRGKPHTSM